MALVSQYSTHQACNHFKVIGTMRLHIQRKYRLLISSFPEWEVTFKNERVIP